MSYAREEHTNRASTMVSASPVRGGQPFAPIILWRTLLGNLKTATTGTFPAIPMPDVRRVPMASNAAPFSCTRSARLLREATLEASPRF